MVPLGPHVHTPTIETRLGWVCVQGRDDACARLALAGCEVLWLLLVGVHTLGRL
jgi:hypothetical protein